VSPARCNARLRSSSLADARIRAKMKDIPWGWGSPVTADEADNSYRTLGVGGSHASASKLPVDLAHPGVARTILLCHWRCSVQSLFSDLGFTISVLLAVAITAFFAFVFEVTLQLVVSMLFVGVFTAIAEYVMRSGRRPS
jgi:hypothetical protein